MVIHKSARQEKWLAKRPNSTDAATLVAQLQTIRQEEESGRDVRRRVVD